MARIWETVTFVLIQAFILYDYSLHSKCCPLEYILLALGSAGKFFERLSSLSLSRFSLGWICKLWPQPLEDHNYLWPLISCGKIMKFSSGNSLLTSIDTFLPGLHIKEQQGVWLFTSHTWCLILPLFACCSFFPFYSSCSLPTSVFTSDLPRRSRLEMSTTSPVAAVSTPPVPLFCSLRFSKIFLNRGS